MSLPSALDSALLSCLRRGLQPKDTSSRLGVELHVQLFEQVAGIRGRFPADP